MVALLPGCLTSSALVCSACCGREHLPHFIFHWFGPPAGLIATALLCMLTLGMAPTLEVLPSVIFMELQVAQAWEVVREYGGYTPCVGQLIQIQLFIIVRLALCGSILVVELGGSQVGVADPSASKIA